RPVSVRLSGFKYLLFNRRGRIAKDGSIGGHISDYDRSGSYTGILSNLHSGHDSDARTDKDAVSDLHARVDHRAGTDLHEITDLYLMLNGAVGMVDAMLANASGRANRHLGIDKIPMPDGRVSGNISCFVDRIHGLGFP